MLRLDGTADGNFKAPSEGFRKVNGDQLKCRRVGVEDSFLLAGNTL